MDNRTIAARLTEYANQLVRERENLYRVRAYRQAAQTVLGLERPLHELLADSGTDGLAALPGIGTHLAYTLEHLLLTGEVIPHPLSRAGGQRCYPLIQRRGSPVA